MQGLVGIGLENLGFLSYYNIDLNHHIIDHGIPSISLIVRDLTFMVFHWIPCTSAFSCLLIYLPTKSIGSKCGRSRFGLLVI